MVSCRLVGGGRGAVLKTGMGKSKFKLIFIKSQLSPPLSRLNRRDQRLESVLMLWCGSCEPSYWCKYVHVNIKSANGQALSREAALPDYARGRPDTVVKLLRERHDRGSMMSIACQPGQEVGQFWVEKSDGTLRAMQLTAVRAGTCSGPYTAASSSRA